MHPKNVSAFLDQGLSPLMPKTRRLLDLQRALTDALPPALAQACLVANVKQGKVLVYATNSAVAAKLRLLGSALQTRLSQVAGEVTGLDVQVQVPPQSGARRPAKPPLSAPALQALRELERQLVDPSIKKVITALLDANDKG